MWIEAAADERSGGKIAIVLWVKDAVNVNRSSCDERSGGKIHG